MYTRIGVFRSPHWQKFLAASFDIKALEAHRSASGRLLVSRFHSFYFSNKHRLQYSIVTRTLRAYGHFSLNQVMYCSTQNIVGVSNHCPRVIYLLDTSLAAFRISMCY